MNIKPLPGWDAPGNHDSHRTPTDLRSLIEQTRNLPGIATQNYDGIPSIIKLFAQKCIHGDRQVLVVKGIHQRWNNNPQPHIRIRFFYTQGQNLTVTSMDMHVQLSEDPSHWDAGNFCWKTVGLTYVVGDKNVQSWPAVYSQEVGQIQQQGKNRNTGVKFKRRMSVGCMPPPQVGAQGPVL